jgi:glyoxylase-like metal-dependent hydrolase (beta-lactamase superfamily II)
MLRRITLALLALVLAGVAFVGVGLWLAKRAIAAIDPPLPSVEDILAFDERADLPVRVAWINTASQKMPRSAVLDASLDPTPASPYVMSHPSFVLEWADGRMFLIDAGMDRESATAFGRPLEWVSGADPIEPLGSTAEQLGPALTRVRGIAFTHEHTDHTSGVAELCRLRTKPLALFQNPLQIEESNFTTRPGQKQIAEAGCLEPKPVESGPLKSVLGFSGLLFFAAAGHTPGSQVFVAHVRSGGGVRTWIFTGDVVNQIDGVRQNIPKPALYSALVVPESTARLDVLRRFLAGLERDHGVGLLVSHDQLSIEASGISKY